MAPDYCGDEVNELAVASFNYVKQDIADVKKRYISLGFHLHEMELCGYHEELGYDNFYECIERTFIWINLQCSIACDLGME